MLARLSLPKYLWEQCRSPEGPTWLHKPLRRMPHPLDDPRQSFFLGGALRIELNQREDGCLLQNPKGPQAHKPKSCVVPPPPTQAAVCETL